MAEEVEAGNGVRETSSIEREIEEADGCTLTRADEDWVMTAADDDCPMRAAFIGFVGCVGSAPSDIFACTKSSSQISRINVT